MVELLQMFHHIMVGVRCGRWAGPIPYHDLAMESFLLRLSIHQVMSGFGHFMNLFQMDEKLAAIDMTDFAVATLPQG